jgi:hypothetical protein
MSAGRRDRRRLFRGRVRHFPSGAATHPSDTMSRVTTLPLSPDELLTTTRSVRKRLELTRPVPMELIRECLEVALQAPSGSNRQTWHWLVVTDAGQRRALGDIYRRAVDDYLNSSGSAAKLFAEDESRGAAAGG